MEELSLKELKLQANNHLTNFIKNKSLFFTEETLEIVILLMSSFAVEISLNEIKKFVLEKD